MKTSATVVLYLPLIQQDEFENAFHQSVASKHAAMDTKTLYENIPPEYYAVTLTADTDAGVTILNYSLYQGNLSDWQNFIVPDDPLK